MIFVYWEWWISIEANKICYFGLALSGISSQPTRLSDVLNLKNLKTIWGIKLIFCFHWSYKNIILFWVMPENTFGQSVCRIFFFWLVWLVNLIPGFHGFIVLVEYVFWTTTHEVTKFAQLIDISNGNNFQESFEQFWGQVLGSSSFSF